MISAVCFLVISFIVRRGLVHGRVTFVNFTSGSVIANFEGTVNVTTLTCNVTNEGTQITTFWSVGNFRGVSETRPIDVAGDLFTLSGDPIPNLNLTYLNKVTVSNLTFELDGVWLFCGTGSVPEQADIVFRIYRPPNLRDNFMLKIQEGNVSIPVDISQEPFAFPEPTDYMWLKDGQPLRNGLTKTYSNITFNSVLRTDSGIYTVFAANTLLNDTSQQIGNDSGSFHLNVLYPPTLTEGPTRHYVLLGDRLSLICGTGLDSNPPANITWTAPDGITIVNNARYNLENGPEIVRLNFAYTLLRDSGLWQCEIATKSERDVLSGETIIRLDSSVIGSIHVDIQLTVIAPPGQPQNLSVDLVKATSFGVSWAAPVVADSPISHYVINAMNLNRTGGMNMVVAANTTTNATSFHVTGLFPGTTYEMTVVAASQGGDIVAESLASDPVVDSTDITVPAVSMCHAAVSVSGDVTVTWSYIHTGGLPLTDIFISYTYEYDSVISNPNHVPVTSINTTSITLVELQAGFRYTFNVTAENSYGASSTLCEATIHIISDYASESNINTIIIGGVLGASLLIGIVVITIVLIIILIVQKKGATGRKVISVKAEVVYDEPENILHQHQSKGNEEIELKDCPAYGKPHYTEKDIETEECPAYYVKDKRDIRIHLQECPAYGESKRQLDVGLEQNPAYLDIATCNCFK